MKIGIFINSSNRHDNVRTLRQLPSSWKKITHIVTPEEQAKKYEVHGWPIIPIPEGIPRYLSSQRQWIMEKRFCDYVFFMDDDLDFSYRPGPGVQLKKSGPEQMASMLEDVVENMEEFPIVGISTRMGNNRVTGDYDDIARVTRCYCVDSHVFLKVGCDFAPYEPFAMQDFHVTLCFLEKGYPNRVLYKYAQGDPGSNTPGGVSCYRTSETHERAAKFIAANHPTSVQLRVKGTKAGWDGFARVGEETVRTDVVVSWKKAYHPVGNHSSTQNGISSFGR